MTTPTEPPGWPPPPGPAEVRALAREYATVVQPGEILVIRVSDHWSPAQAAELQGDVDCWLLDHAPDVKAIVLPGDAASAVPAEALNAAADAAVGRALARRGSIAAGPGGGTPGASGGNGTGPGGGSAGHSVTVQVGTDPRSGRVAFMPTGGCCGEREGAQCACAGGPR